MKYFYPKYIYKKKLLKFFNQTFNLKGMYAIQKNFESKMINNFPNNIKKDLGYLFLENKIFLPKNLIKHLESYCDTKRINQMKKNNNEKKFMINLLEEKDIQNIPGLLDFILSDDILSLATNYLNTTPFLAYVRIFYSFPNHSSVSSQLFHCDTEDDNQLKFFFYLDDVDENNGPFVFIPKNKSLLVMRKNKYQGKRIKDEDVYKFISSEDALKFLGKKGAGLAIDTCRCLHYGSRENKGTRKLLMIQFTNHFANLYYKSILNEYLDYTKIQKHKHIHCKPQKRLF